MVALNNPPVRFGFAGLDNLTFVVRVVELKAVRFPRFVYFSYAEVLQRNDPSRFFICRVFKVVEAVVCQNEPPPLPRFDPATELQEPAFSVGVEECVRQIVPIILWDFERLVFDAVVKVPEQLLWQITSFVDAPVHGDKALDGGLVSHVRVVQAGVQHDDGK